MTFKLAATTALTLFVAGAASAATDLYDGSNQIGTYEGKAGIGTANGDVGASPLGNKYLSVTTAGSSYYGAGLSPKLGGETNGSVLTTLSFSVEANDELEYYFNYVTSDGTSNYVEYAYAYLNNLDTGASTLIFTARTNPSGNTVPGFGMPPIAMGVELDPDTSPVAVKKTNWAELGGSSGTCYNVLGCGSTGWIQSLLTVETAGNYSLSFGVVNWGDIAYQTGLAIAGIKVGGNVIIDPNTPVVPLPAAGWLLIAGLGGLGALSRRKRAA